MENGTNQHQTQQKQPFTNIPLQTQTNKINTQTYKKLKKLCKKCYLPDSETCSIEIAATPVWLKTYFKHFQR